MSDVADKWGQEVAERGFAQVPNYLLLLNQFADEESRLTPLELVVLIQLVGAWWKKDEAPFPAMRTLALRAGTSERQMHRAVTSLEGKGLLRREKRKIRGIISSNVYNLEPLVETLKDVARVYETPHKRDVSHKTPAEGGLKIKPKPRRRQLRRLKAPTPTPAE